MVICYAAYSIQEIKMRYFRRLTNHEHRLSISVLCVWTSPSMEVDISSYTEVEDKVFENMAPSLNISPSPPKKKLSKTKKKFYV